MNRRSPPDRVEYGDWQTPPALAAMVVARAIAGAPTRFAAVLEPTCGEGSLLAAAAEAIPGVELRGLDRDPIHLAAARARLGERASLREADFFHVDWEAEVARLPEPLLIVGNPPWVTSAALGALDSQNLPPRSTRADLRGLAAITGRSNFDLAEAMIVRLLAATRGRSSRVAMLCKASVARRIVTRADAEGWGLGGSLWAIDAREHFAADVDAVLLIAEADESPVDPATPRRWPSHDHLDASAPARHLGLVDGRLCGDLALAAATRHLEGPGATAWRSGVKHDCASVMELRRRGDAWVNGQGERVDVEAEVLFPLLKGSDLARGAAPTRALICPQRRLGDDPRELAATAPRALRYLESHRARLDARRSRIYRGRPPYAIFGVGAYTFAPWKVAIAGLYKRLEFRVVGPVDGRPVVVDDTCYFLPCADEVEARRRHEALTSAAAHDFFAARIFWDQKRPITRELLQALALERLIDS